MNITRIIIPKLVYEHYFECTQNLTGDNFVCNFHLAINFCYDRVRLQFNDQNTSHKAAHACNVKLMA